MFIVLCPMTMGTWSLTKSAVVPTEQESDKSVAIVYPHCDQSVTYAPWSVNCIHSAWKNQAITSVKIWKDNMHSPESLSHSFAPTCSLPYCYLTNNPSPSSPKTILTFTHSLFNHISSLFVHTFWFFLQVEVQGTLGMCLNGEGNSIHSHILPWSLKKAISMYVCNTTAPLCGN